LQKIALMNFKIHPDFAAQEAAVKSLIANFDGQGEPVGEAARNSIKVFNLDGRRVNVKSFKVPNIINGFIYGYIRKSKARRSYEYANRLRELGVGTPQPIAYAENFDAFGLEDSYYVSEQLGYDLMYRELTTNPNYPDREEILRQFVRFSFELHEKGIEFIDNASGNTLICKGENGRYAFFLVDLNRMNFHDSFPLAKRIANLAKLTNDREVVAIMSEEYAKLANRPLVEINALLQREADAFLDNFHRRRRLKQKIRFWRR
jgi:hypothetical protein